MSGAKLTGAKLRNANLTGSNLPEANLNYIKFDVWTVFNYYPHEVRGVQTALREGRIEGRRYEGQCADLIGTIANQRNCSYQSLVIKPDSSRPAERWFFAIQRGDTPENSPIVKLTEEWIEEWKNLPITSLALARA